MITTTVTINEAAKEYIELKKDPNNVYIGTGTIAKKYGFNRSTLRKVVEKVKQATVAGENHVELQPQGASDFSQEQEEFLTDLTDCAFL